MATLCEMTADWRGLIDLHQRMAELANDDAGIVGHHLAIARIARDALNDRQACNDHAQRALELDPPNAEALRLRRES
jgi:hypothetical protein